jgi:hypothetical protein
MWEARTKEADREMPRRVRRPSDWNDPDLWGHHLDDQGDRNARLYDHGATFYADLSVLTELWLSELNNVRLSSIGAPPNAAAKQPGPRPHEPPSAPDLRTVTADGGKTVLLRLDGRRTRHGYKGVEVLDEPLSTDVAVLAALAVLEVPESPKQTLKRLTAILRAEGGKPLGETVHDRVHEMLAQHEERGKLSDKDARFLEGLDTRPFDFCLVLLRGRRAGFEDLALGEQLGLLERAFAYVEPVVSNARKLARFLEHGDVKGVPTRVPKTAQRQVAAALLSDAAGLTAVEIADELGINKPRNVNIKSDVPQVRREAEAGRELLRRALGAAGAEDLVKARRAEMGWWRSLTEEQKNKQRRADWWVYDGWPEGLAGGLGFSAGTGSDEAGNA